jgi:hypothetical protein
LAKAKYGGGDGADNTDEIIDAIGNQVVDLVHQQAPVLEAELINKIPRSLQPELAAQLATKIEKEMKSGSPVSSAQKVPVIGKGCFRPTSCLNVKACLRLSFRDRRPTADEDSRRPA